MDGIGSVPHLPATKAVHRRHGSSNPHGMWHFSPGFLKSRAAVFQLDLAPQGGAMMSFIRSRSRQTERTARKLPTVR
jgi:hypothetical protein